MYWHTDRVANLEDFLPKFGDFLRSFFEIMGFLGEF
jgi:hypothetical protein